MKTIDIPKKAYGLLYIFLIIIFTQICETASGCTFQDETFDSHANGSSMYGQCGWICWGNNLSVTAFVTQDQFFSSV